MAFLGTTLAGLPRRQGKVRDVYDLGDRLLMVATDRISAFDWILPVGIPDKGRILTGLSAFWFGRLGIPHHLISTDVAAAGLGLDLEGPVATELDGRSMVVRKADVIPFECVVRGYLAGSAWKEYRQGGTVAGEPLPPGLRESDPLGAPRFTPAVKAETGHDENISYTQLVEALGAERAAVLRDRSLEAYEVARRRAEARGLILADTKFEWGTDPKTGELLLVDEVLTPDSSRFWSAASYRPGGPQPSFDKQYVRDWLEGSGWDKASPPPPLPDAVVAETRNKYVEAFEILTGRAFPWK